jgi:hypothetical protein
MMKNKNRQVFIILVFVLWVLTFSGCANSPAAAEMEDQPTSPAVPTAAATVVQQKTVSPQAAISDEITATPAAAPDTACSLPLPSDKDWPVVICETFEDDSGAWTVESQDNPYARYSIDIRDGAYALAYTAKGFANFQRTALTWFEVASAKDFALSVTTRMNSDFQKCSWGVAFRVDEDSFFLFTINNDNTYVFEIYENNTWIPLISQRPYDGILYGEDNKLTIIAEGGDFTFYINDVLVNNFSGGLLQGSDIQLMVSAKEGVNVDYSFDDIVLQTNS